MRGRWELRDWEMESWKHLFRLYIEGLERGAEDFNLSDKDLNPYQAYRVLGALGWEEIEIDRNGNWEQDIWATFQHPNHERNLIVFSCGMTFELKIYLEEEE